MHFILHPRWGVLPRLVILLLGAGSPAFCAPAADLVAVPDLGLRIARGFRVTLFADDALAPDIYAMAFNARGQLVVTSQGYVRELIDSDGDGVADESIERATTKSGGMGLGFDGDDMMLVADGAVWRFHDGDGDGFFDGEAQRLFPLSFGEHGGHAVRKGPDGWWYVVAGNDSKFTNDHITLRSAPVSKIEGGALLRFSADGRQVEPVAHGFRNPYDFDFNSAGDLFTYDSDMEADYFLPWYTPTRLYHVEPAAHHGWRLEGWKRSFARRDDVTDTVGMLAPIGRGSPTGVACYRHTAFSDLYHDGLFFLDWTFGRLHFAPLDDVGSSYVTTPEVFLEPLGTHGFAPTDVAIGPDGALYVSVGGRKTRGGVYKIEFAADPDRTQPADDWLQLADSDAEAAVSAPQPLDAWSRALWVPLALRAGPEPFNSLATDARVAIDQRVRAVEILTELHGGLGSRTANACVISPAPLVRARTAWSLGRVPCENFGPLLLTLTRDATPAVRVAALESLRAHAAALPLVTLQQAIAANLPHPDQRVRHGAARLAAALPEPAWKALLVLQKNGHAQARLTVTLAGLWRQPPAVTGRPDTNAIENVLGVLANSALLDYRRQSLRLLQLALGDWDLEGASQEVFTACTAALPLDPHSPLVARLRRTVTAWLPLRDHQGDAEAARLLAMLEADDPTLPAKFLAACTPRSSATSDFHYLACLAQLPLFLPTNTVNQLAAVITSLDRKLAGQQQRIKQNWSVRLNELVNALRQPSPHLASALLQQPDFARPGNLALVPALGSEHLPAAARLFVAAVRRESSFPWSGELIDVLSALPATEVKPLLRQQWSNLALRDRLVVELARQPEPQDREKFVSGLASAQPETQRAGLNALLALPREESTRTYPAVLKNLRALLNQPKEATARAQIVAYLARQTGQPFRIADDTTDLARSYQPVFDWFQNHLPAALRALDTDDAEDPVRWNLFYKSVPWTRGDIARGEAIFQERGCVTCHAGASPLGPDLAGAAARMSATDLFNAIIFPSRDVAAPYRMMSFLTRDGQTVLGQVAFQSADGVLLRTGAATTVRLADGDIVNRQPSGVSLMPSGLLANLSAQGCADLYAYLKAARTNP